MYSPFPETNFFSEAKGVSSNSNYKQFQIINQYNNKAKLSPVLHNFEIDELKFCYLDN